MGTLDADGRGGVPIRQARWFKLITAVLIVVFFHLAVLPAGWAQEEPVVGYDERTEPTGTQFGVGAASFFLTLPYGAAKVVYAVLGGIIGGFTYALTAGNAKAANSVWTTSLRGTYVITPEHLKGEKTVRFFGMPPETTPAPEPVLEPAPAVNP